MRAAGTAGLLQKSASRWLQLIILSIVLAALFERIGLPASRLLGPMVAAIALTLRGSGVDAGRGAFICAQGVVGCLVGRSVPGSFLDSMSAHWSALFLGVTAVTVLAYGLGWVLSRRKTLPLAAAIWGSAPGGASAMLILAEAQGADVRLVTFMQYLRVVCVSLAASLVAHWSIPDGGASAAQGAAAASALLPPPSSWLAVAASLAVAVGGAYLGTWLRIPAGAMLVPMGAYFLLQNFANVTLELHPLMLALAYAAIGWTIGIRFDRQVLALCLGSLPMILASTLTLIVLCAAVGAALVQWAGIDPLTAYLATSPGGVDVVAIIAASTPVDLAFVVSMQVLRLLLVLATAPLVALLLSRTRRM
ncbi:MAG: ammonia monooxygenase [Ramlibacter sp.]|jgi:membrane AbrB-like protein|nr:ammonia monooxygenase [Ramlibacter sp.]